MYFSTGFPVEEGMDIFLCDRLTLSELHTDSSRAVVFGLFWIWISIDVDSCVEK